jgi:hypothetical protein
MQPRVLVASNYNDGMPLYNALSFEFCEVVRRASGADLLAPPEIARDQFRSLLATAAEKSARAVQRKRRSHLQTVTVEGDYDLFFYVCMNPNHLAELQSLRGWRERSRKAAVFIFESWSSWLAKEKPYLKMLDQFDHVFLFNKASIPTVRSYTSTPCSFLSAGADCLTATPYPHNPPRLIDVYSMGRRSETTHRQLFAMAQSSEIFYLFDAGSRLRVYDYAQARFLTLNNIKRSRYFVAYDLSVGPKGLESAGEEALPARLFEGAAGGSVMIGTKPKCPEFDELFDWPDAIVEIPVEPEDMRSVLARLDAEPERLAQASFMNATQSLRRHDWVYRWEDILQTMGFDVPAGVRARRARLHALADEAEASRSRRMSKQPVR